MNWKGQGHRYRFVSVKTIQCYFRADGKPGSLKKRTWPHLWIRCACWKMDSKYWYSRTVLSTPILSSLLATAAIHHHLIRKGMHWTGGYHRGSRDVWEVHHFACLCWFRRHCRKILTWHYHPSVIWKKPGKLETSLSEEELKKNYIMAVNDGLLKVFSKMGISLYSLTRAAWYLKYSGLNPRRSKQIFYRATSRIEGMRLDEIAKEVLAKHYFAFSKKIFRPTGCRLVVFTNGKERWVSFIQPINNSSPATCYQRWMIIAL